MLKEILILDDIIDVDKQIILCDYVLQSNFCLLYTSDAADE